MLIRSYSCGAVWLESSRNDEVMHGEGLEQSPSNQETRHHTIVCLRGSHSSTILRDKIGRYLRTKSGIKRKGSNGEEKVNVCKSFRCL